MGEYHDMAMDVLREAERDGIRTMSGHHIREPVEHSVRWIQRHPTGRSIPFNRPVYGTTLRCTCGEKFTSNQAPSRGGKTDVMIEWRAHVAASTPVWEREGRHIECLPCGDQGCDFCNEPVDLPVEYDDTHSDYQTRAEWREQPLDGEGNRDWTLDR